MGFSKKSVGLALGTLGVAGVSVLLAYGARKADPRFYRTKFGPAVVCTTTDADGRAVRLLLVGRSVQSATYVDEEYRAEPVFDYYLADLSRVVREELGGEGRDSEFARQARRRYGAGFGQRYDAMVFDVFAGKKPVASLASPTAIRNAHTCLNPGGVLIANVVSTLEGPKSAFLHQYVEALEGEFAHVHVIPLSPDGTDAPDNVILLATDATWEFAGM